MEFPYYPINGFGPAMHGMVIGAIGIVHVFLAQFAIGGGMLLCYFQWLSQTGRCQHAKRFIDDYFQLLVLISFVIGAVTGVGMWFTTIQISPRTIGMMVAEFHWMWAIEWSFFCLEIVSGYCFYRYGARLDDRTRFRLLVLYSFAAWFSLFWINGILAWQLTPGDWLTNGSVWSGFFNPSFWPSLIFRTVTSMTIASLSACLVINFMTGLNRAERTELINRAATFLRPMIVMPLLAGWFLWTIPEESRSWALGASPLMSMFFMMAAGSSLLIGLYAFMGLLREKLFINAATASLLCALAFSATAGGEFVREGIRKPFTVHRTLYSNSILPEEIPYFRETGCVTNDPYPLKNAGDLPNEQIVTGARVFRMQCSICHTLAGSNGLTHLTGTWTATQLRLNIAMLQRTKPFMPPFAGTPEELEALVQYLSWQNASRPANWGDSRNEPDHSQTLSRIRSWLEEAGIEPGIEKVSAAASKERR
jgi:hypothetical protein